MTGITVACALLHTPYDFKSVRQIASTASPLIFLIAGVRVFYSGRSGYILGLVAALAGLSWFVGLERVLRRNLTNTWIVFNLPDEGLHGTRDTIAFAEWRVVAVALLIVALACSALRFLPRDWKLATTSISQRTWPAIAFSLSLLAAWYAASVSPYRIPYIVDAGWPDVTILHVEKRGLRFREIGVSIRRDMGFRVGRNERKWFQYRFLRRGVRGTAPENLHPQVTALLNSPELAILRTPSAKPLRRWNDEGWYVLIHRSRVLAFVNGTEPPREITDLFSAIQALPAGNNWQSGIKDVCLGFCYDPLAGLGLIFVNDRCHTDEHGSWCE